MTTTTEPKTREQLQAEFDTARANAREARQKYIARRAELDEQLQAAFAEKQAAEAVEARAKYALDNHAG